VAFVFKNRPVAKSTEGDEAVRKWTVRDCRGREICLTEERRKHIIERHEELSEHLDDVLDTVRKGHRRQDVNLPYRYTFMRRCEDLPDDFDHIMVKAIFTTEGNNLIVTEWPDYLEIE